MPERTSPPRPALDADGPRLRSIVVAAYRPYLLRMDRAPGPMTHDLGPDVAAGRVWVSGRPVVGLICLVPTGRALLIENIAVHPDAQGRGVGRRLMSFAERRACGLGVDLLELYTNEVMTENQAFYRSLGYEEVDRRSDGGYRRVFMAKSVAGSHQVRAPRHQADANADPQP